MDDVWAECEDLFQQARTQLATLRDDPPPHAVQAAINGLFRATHTLKGMAGMLGFTAFSRSAHRMEDLFDLMRQGRLRSSDSLLDTLEMGMQALEAGIEDLKRGRPEPDDYLAPMRRQLGELEALAKPQDGRALDLSALLDLSPEVLKALSDYERMRVTAVLRQGVPVHGLTLALDFLTFDEVLRQAAEGLGKQGELISTLPWDTPPGKGGLAFLLLVASSSLDLEALGLPAGTVQGLSLLGDPARVPRDLRSDLPPVEAPAEAEAEAEPRAEAAIPAPAEAPAALPAAPQEAEVLRMPVQRVEELEAQLLEVVQLRDAVGAWMRGAQDATPGREYAQKLLGRMEDQLLAIQKALLQVRLVKVESLFSRLEPLARNLSRDLGKPIKLTFTGGELELERSIVGKLVEPFIHLLRNALDHGLETPDERKAVGKSETGTLKISASQRGRTLRFDIRDDGRGFDLSRIEAKGLALGLIQPGVHTPEALHRLVFEPGFSTAEKTSEISGRGVGMDVVRAEIEALGGEVHLSSEWKRGSLVRLSFPLARAILTCLKVRAGGFTFGLPLSGVARVQLGEPPRRGGDRVLVRGQDLPFESLQSALGRPEPAEGQRAFVVLSQNPRSASSLEVALGVDEVMERGEILLRSLPEHCRMPAVMGGSLQEDGVLWVLDPEELLGQTMESLMRRVVARA